MYIIISKDFREFVAGIFAVESHANDFRQKISEGELSKLKFEDVPLSYPLYISEDHEGFSYHSEESAKELMADFTQEMHKRDEEWCYTNLYRVSEDFMPKMPGKNYMGLIPHHHVDNNTLKSIKENGFNSLWDL
ncbi:hypothetical protein M0C34_13905 [Agarivorans sp. TSD2052]|uniref:hypothetical protein n=1 Tax=Agarivorans sp. TSD2052 TaxID=2937286 RepID=UPI00200FF6AE|nr:hypothetical protein [Agarivorans sp. TSD2052]UPW17332.1 hypothetical protein M0C34_13905 [Agarivorans sp. TSD2052]